MTEQTWIGLHPGGRDEYDNQCARCGSSLMWVDCDNCGGEGLSGHECGEDTCCCSDPDEDNLVCGWCEGAGGHWQCLSSQDYCAAHPREGREALISGTPEWFRIGRVS